MKRKSPMTLIFLLPMVVLTLVFQIYPLFLNLFYSFLNWNGITRTANFIGLGNYKSLIHDGLFWHALSNSLIYAFLATALELTVSFLLAYLTEYSNIRHKGIYRVIFILPIVATPATIGMVFKSMFSYDGLINRILTGLGGSPVPWLSDSFYAFVLILVVSVWKETGTLYIYWIAGFQTISKDVVEAAKLDGAGAGALLWEILLPMMKPIITVISGMSLINAIKQFDLIQTLTGGGPYFATDVLSTYIYQNAFSSSFGLPRFSYASACAIFVVLIASGLALIVKSVQFLIRRRQTCESAC